MCIQVVTSGKEKNFLKYFLKFLGGAPSLSRISSGLFGGFLWSRGVKIYINFFQKISRGAPSVSRIRSGLFDAFRWSLRGKNMYQNIFSKNLSGGPLC